jgi:hypothetical protein
MRKDTGNTFSNMKVSFYYFPLWRYSLNSSLRKILTRNDYLTQFKSKWDEKVKIKEVRKTFNKVRFVLLMKSQGLWFIFCFYFMTNLLLWLHDHSAWSVKVLMTLFMFMTKACSCHKHIYYCLSRLWSIHHLYKLGEVIPTL